MNTGREYTCGDLTGTDCESSRARYYEPETEPVTYAFTDGTGREITIMPDEDPEPPGWYWYAQKHPHGGDWEDPKHCPDCGVRLLITDDGEPEALPVHVGRCVR